MRWRRVLAGLGGLVLLAIVALGGALLWVIRTESGTGWLVRRIAASAGTALSIDAVSGTLLDGISVTRARVVFGGAELTIDSLRLRASLSELLARRVVVYELSAGTARYSREALAARDASRPKAVLDLPISIELRRVSIDSLEVTTPEARLDFVGTSFASDLDDSTLRLRDVQTSIAGFGIRADATLAFEEDGLRQSAEFGWSTEIDGIAWSGSGRTAGSLELVQFEHRLDAPFSVAAAGELRLARTPQAHVNLEWENLNWPGFELARSPSGTAELNGWLDRFDFSGSGQAIVRDVSIAFTSAGSATPHNVAFTALALESELGDADLAGDVDLDAMSWDLRVDARGLDPGRLIDGWPGGLSASGQVRGSLEPELKWSVSGLEVAGTLRDRNVAGSGNVSSNRAGEWQLDDVELDWGGNLAAISGSAGTALDLTVHLDAGRLDALRPGLDGRLTLDGEVGGSFADPAFVGTAAVDKLALGRVGIERLSFEGRLSAVEQAEISLRFEANGISAERPIVESITGSIDGTTASHTVAVEIRPVIGSGSLSANGSFSDGAWTGEILSAVLDQDLLGSWSLAEPANLSVSGESIALDYACLRKAAADLCLGARFGTDDDVLDLNVNAFDIAWLQPLIAAPVTIAGLYDAAVHLRGPVTRPTGSVSVRGESSKISINDVEAPLEIPIEDISLDAELTESRLEASASFRTAAETSVTVDGAVTEIWTPAPRINATVEGTWADLGVLSLLSPDIGRVTGLATLSLALSGPLEAPEVQGEANWTGGEIAVPRWGIAFANVDASVTSRTGRELIYDMSATAGNGTMALTGETLLDPDARWPTSLNVRGENLAAVQLPEAQILISPDLEIFTAWPEVNVTGTVAVPTASLSLDALPAQSAAASPDVVVHGAEASAPQRPLDVFANLSLVLGDDVRFSGSGLDARLRGRIDLDYRSGRAAVATGTLTLAGEYMTFNQTLELDRGQLLFDGTVTNPALDVRAIRTFETSTEDVDVGVTVTGTVRQPVTRLYSDPSMSDGDIISYLVVGRPLSDSSRENAEALQTAALSMGITQALPQIQHFGEIIGLDELGLRTSEASTGELMAGKQVSSRIYMRYSYGLINRVGGLLLRFRLSDNLSLETRTGDSKAMDLLYMIERQ